MNTTVLCINGEFKDASQPLLHTHNRSFRYGDGAFESIRIIKGKPCFMGDHFKRLLQTLKFIKIEVPLEWNIQYFETQITELLKKNNINTDARIRLSVYRNGDAWYVPETNTASYILEAFPLNEQGYTLNNKGLTIDVFQDIKKPIHPLSRYKTANGLMYVLAGVFCHKNNFDECILMNDKFCILEGVSSNLFAVKNGVLYTPPVSDGCIDGVMRKQILAIAAENRIAAYEISLSMGVILSADELFFTNSIQGIRWTSAYRDKRYFCNVSRTLTEKLNQRLMQTTNK